MINVALCRQFLGDRPCRVAEVWGSKVQVRLVVRLRLRPAAHLVDCQLVYTGDGEADAHRSGVVRHPQ